MAHYDYRDGTSPDAPLPASKRQIGGDHYKAFDIQPAEFIARNKIGFLPGSAIKYICRYPLKGGRQDIEKAIHFLQLILEYEYGDEPEPT